MNWQPRRGQARQGAARPGVAWRGLARRAMEWQPRLPGARPGKAWIGTALHGAWRGVFTAPQGMAATASSGEAGHGVAANGAERYGLDYADDGYANTFLRSSSALFCTSACLASSAARSSKISSNSVGNPGIAAITCSRDTQAATAYDLSA